MTLDVGLMPLTDDVWTRGKCGFKALQYMALGIPAMASPVGVNTSIIDHGVNGFLCSSAAQWIAGLKELAGNPGLRQQMGRQGRKKIVDHYSVTSNTSTFLSLFE